MLYRVGVNLKLRAQGSGSRAKNNNNPKMCKTSGSFFFLSAIHGFILTMAESGSILRIAAQRTALPD